MNDMSNIHWTFEKSIYDDNPTIESDLLANLKSANEIRFPNRDSVPLWSPAIFDASLTDDDKYKTRANVLATTALVFDFDGSMVDPRKVIEDHFKGYGLLAHNSFNNGNPAKGPGTRFRIILPFTDPMAETATTARYEAIWDYFSRDITATKYSLDKSKRGAQSFFYLPAETDHPLWIDRLSLPFIDPMEILASDECCQWFQHIYEIEQQRLALEAERQAKIVNVPVTDKIKIERAEKALEKFAGTDNGHNRFFKYALSLYRHAQLDLAAVEYRLRANAHLFGTDKNDRLKEIPHTLKKLQKS